MEQLENFRLHEIKKEIELASEQVTEGKLNQAIAKGLDRARKARMVRQVGWQAGIMAGLLTLSLFLLNNWGQDMTGWGNSSSNSFVQGSQGNIPGYVQSQMSSEMKAAAEQGLYQSVNLSEQTGPYQVTVDGLLADQQQMYLFITLTNLLEESSPMELADFSFYDPKGDRYPNILTSPGFTPNDKYKTVQHLTYSLAYDKSPNGQIVFSGSIEPNSVYAQESAFEISIEWNPDIYKDMKRTIALGRTEVIEGHAFTLNSLVLTPLATALEVHTEPLAGTGIEGFMDNKLIINRQQETQFRDAVYPRNSQYRYVAADNLSLSRLFYGSIYYHDISEITFQASGITLNSLHPFEITIDTDKQQIITAPSNFTLLGLKEGSDQEVELQLRYTPAQPDNPDLEPLSFSFKRNFLDQEGNQQSFLSGDYTDKIVTLRFNSLPYLQPLTITGSQIEKEQIKQAIQWDFPFVEK